MREPAALKKATVLERYMFGAPKSDAILTLNDREAWEFLKWYRRELADSTLFDCEMRRAKALHDPWPVLSGITICGFQVGRCCHEMH